MSKVKDLLIAEEEAKNIIERAQLLRGEKLTLILNKEYTPESLTDVEEDIFDSIGRTPIPQDEHGFEKGSYQVLVTFKEDT